MITMNEFVDLRMQQHIAHEIYRHQIMQRIPDPFPPILPIAIPRHIVLPSRANLPGVEIALQNDELWKQFHQIGTEMIITKSGRRMFPSMRLSISGLENESNYCILLEMVPTGDCRYKFSGSQWVPAGGAEPQSPQRMYLHTDSPASGAHWQAQPILFNKVKLTNNTLDNNGHIVLASMHKYQPRIHIIRTSDPTQIPWSAQQSFVFPETEFVAVTAYQNDSITKLKIDNNPFAKGFRETGQSRCKRKTSSSPEIHLREMSAGNLTSPSRASTCEKGRHDDGGDPLYGKRIKSNESACSITSLDEIWFPTSISSNSSSGKNSPTGDQIIESRSRSISMATQRPIVSDDKIMENKQHLINSSFFDLASSYLYGPQYPLHNISQAKELPTCLEQTDVSVLKPFKTNINLQLKTAIAGDKNEEPVNVVKFRRNNFSISAILGSNS